MGDSARADGVVHTELRQVTEGVAGDACLFKRADDAARDFFVFECVFILLFSHRSPFFSIGLLSSSTLTSHPHLQDL